VETIDTADRKAKILRDMLGINAAIASKIYKLTSSATVDQLVKYYKENRGSKEEDIFSSQEVIILISLI